MADAGSSLAVPFFYYGSHALDLFARPALTTD